MLMVRVNKINSYEPPKDKYEGSSDLRKALVAMEVPETGERGMVEVDFEEMERLRDLDERNLEDLSELA